MALGLARLSWQSEIAPEGRPAAAVADALERAEGLLMRLGRTLIPSGYVAGSPYYQDPALPTCALPGLTRRVEDLVGLEPDSDLYRPALISVGRERNRVAHALSAARLATEEWLAGGNTDR